MEVLQESLNAANTVITNLTSQIQDKNIISTPESDSVDLDEVFAGLQTQLRQLESEAEDLKAKLQALEVAKDVTVDGSISIADQITSQVDLIRRELTRRHDERVKVEEDRFKKRADKMKEALNKQISKLKDTSRASLSSTSTDTLDNLTKAHVEEIQTLNLRHADEMAELQRHIKSSDEDTNAKSQSSVKFEPTEEQIRELLKSNAYARKLVQNSLDNRTKKAQEDEQLKTEVILKTKQKENAEVLQVELAKVRAEEQKKLDEQIKGLDEKIAKARQDAEALIKKKYDVKFSMTENRMNMAVAKVNYVQKAAKDTPNEAVSKVWETAKDLKPAPKPAVIVPSQSVQSGGPGLSTTISSTIPVGSSSSTTITPKGAAGIFNQAKSDISKPTFGLPSTHLSSGIQRPSGFGQPSGQQQQHPGLTALGISIPNSVANTGGGLQQSQHARGGRASGSAIPRGGGGGSAMRGARGVGSGIPRGGGRGGAIQPSSRAVIKPDPPESPQTPMNPSAAQFVPGQKRSIDSNEHVGGDEKRTKTE